MNSSCALSSLLVIGVVGLMGCSSSDEPGGSAGAGGGSAGGAGQASAGAAQGGASAGSGGGAVAGSAGASAGVGGSSVGSGGASGGSGGASGSASAGAGGASGGSGGGGFWGPNGPKKQWTCPANPGTQMKGASTNQCQNFAFNYGYNEGPTWIASQNAFFFSNFIQGSQHGGDIIKFTLGGTCEVWLHDASCNGLGVSPSGNLLAACQGPRAIMEYDVTTKVGRQVATMVGGKQLDSVNDLIARSDGNVYASNTTYELDDKGSAGVGFALVRVDPMGVSTVVQTGNLNGLALSPDETKLWVVGMGTFDLDAAGVPTKGQGPNPGGDGIAVDCLGNITNEGTNSAFGGTDGKTMIAVGPGKTVRTIAMSVPGLP